MVESRAGGRCEYCRAPQAACGYLFHLEHCVPRSRSGADSPDNLALSCATCNLNKATRVAGIDPVSGVSAPLFNPRADLWNEQFAWSDDGLVIRGRMPVGRATVSVLDLNASLRITARALWTEAGLLPG